MSSSNSFSFPSGSVGGVLLGATETSSRSDHCRSLAFALLLLLLIVSSAGFDGAGSSIELLVFVEFASSSSSSTEFCVGEPDRSTSVTALEFSVGSRLVGDVFAAGANILSSCDASDDCGGGARLFIDSINRLSYSVCFPRCISSFVKLISGSAFSCKYIHSPTGLKHFRLFKNEEQYLVVPSDAFTNLPSNIEL